MAAKQKRSNSYCLRYWRKVIKNIEKNKEFLTDIERQRRDYAKSRIEVIKKEQLKLNL